MKVSRVKLIAMLVMVAIMLTVVRPIIAQESGESLFLPIIAGGVMTPVATPAPSGCEALKPAEDWQRIGTEGCGWTYTGSGHRHLDGGNTSVVLNSTIDNALRGPFDIGRQGPLSIWYEDLSAPKVVATVILIITPVPPTATPTQLPTATATATTTPTLIIIPPTPTATPVPPKDCQALPESPEGAWSYLANEPAACGLKLEAVSAVTVSVPMSWTVNASIDYTGPVTIAVNVASFWRIEPEAEDIVVLEVAPIPAPAPPCENPSYPSPDRWSRIVDESGQPQGCGWQLSPGEEFSLYIPDGWKVVDEGPGFMGPGDHFFPAQKGASLWRLF